MWKESLGWISTTVILPPFSPSPFDQLPSIGVGGKGFIALYLGFVHNHYLLPNPILHRYWANLNDIKVEVFLKFPPANPPPTRL